MARIRTIKPGFFRSEDVSALPRADLLRILHRVADAGYGRTAAGLVDAVRVDAALTTYKKRAIPSAVRREVARRYGVRGGRGQAPCHYCGHLGGIYWMTSAWVVFDHELDHVIPERRGGPTAAANIVLACRPCNRRKGAQV
jgi:5-methylcytosine-specific restriction endonuclease McrA